MSDPTFNLETAFLDRLIDGMEQKADDVCEESATNIRNGMLIAMSGPKSGRFYGNHQASAAGEAPAVMTGALKANIYIEKPANGVRVVVAGQEYAPYLEFGTRYMAARPFMSPEVMRERPNFLRRAGEMFNA